MSEYEKNQIIEAMSHVAKAMDILTILGAMQKDGFCMDQYRDTRVIWEYLKDVRKKMAEAVANDGEV